MQGKVMRCACMCCSSEFLLESVDTSPNSILMPETGSNLTSRHYIILSVVVPAWSVPDRGLPASFGIGQVMSSEEEARRRRGRYFVVGYPFAVLMICIALNALVFGIMPIQIALPGKTIVLALVVASVLLLVNHTWLMTTTELTRGRYGMYATPEEWRASGRKREEAVSEGWEELERRHNAHRNTTENTVYFVFVALVFALTSPSTLAASVWIIGFGVARLGYTYSYLAGKDGLRGLFMSLGLLCVFGIASALGLGSFT